MVGICGIICKFAAMEKVFAYYREKTARHEAQAEALGKRIYLLGSLRLLLVAGLIAALWLGKGESGGVLTFIVAAFVLPFVGLMVWHSRLFARKSYAEAMAQLCRDELKALDYDFSAFDGAPEKNDPAHPFSLDLDLFGPNSLFQSLNRTVTADGRERLAAWFLHPLTDKAAIQQRQEAVRELAALPDLRQHFYVTGILREQGKRDRQVLASLVAIAPCLMRSRTWTVLVWAVPLVWLGLAAGCVAGALPYSALGLFLAVAFVLAYGTSKQVAKIHHALDKMEQILTAYGELIRCIEEQAFHSQALQTLHSRFHADGQPASALIRRLSRYVGALNQRFSLAGVLLNLFTLRDTRMAIRLEQWNAAYGEAAEAWFDALADFDAYASLGAFAFNHPDYVYPEIADRYFQMEGKALGHPLLHRDVCVRNDIDIRRSPSFLIVTGANMAGKSTYLRTVGVNYLLACVGAPVCAESLRVFPAALVTSLRTSDSLVSHESYFFAELKRLKMIIDRLQRGEQLFIILDEILKGTNSEDKQKGSLALMKQLVRYRSCGIIATHDLVLGTLAGEFPDAIENYRFEADIEGDELRFSYRLQPGVARNMNACFLMQKMGITI